MKCDHCDKSATVRETTVRNGVSIERNLCETCAVQMGVLPESPGVIAISAQSAAGVTVGVPSSLRAAVCATCSTTHAEFKQNGLLGCPDCYKVFEAQLGPLLERVHEGGLVHRGKSPPKAAIGTPPDESVIAPDAADSARTLTPRSRTAAAPKLSLAFVHQLALKLQEAIAKERYEDAARLRDELRSARAALSAANKAAGIPPDATGDTPR